MKGKEEIESKRGNARENMIRSEIESELDVQRSLSNMRPTFMMENGLRIL